MQIYLDNQQFNKKPENQEIGIITNKIYKQRADLNLRDLAKEIAEKGRTVMLATYIANLKPSELEQQSLLMLDFDNQDKDNQFTLEQALADRFIRDNACFIYRTFSDSKAVDKFRVVFALDCALESTDEVTMAYRYLLSKYTQADQKTKNPNRLFFGSNSGFIEINFNNRLKKSEVVKEVLEVLEVKEKVKTAYVANEIKQYEIIDNTKVYECIKNKEFKKAKEILAIKYANRNVLNMEFENEISVKNFYTTEVDIVEFLDLPQSKNFCCILTEEENASAGIYRTAKTNIQIYHNFATNFKADLIILIAKLAEINTFEAIELIMYLTSSQLIQDTATQRKLRAVKYFVSKLKSEDLKELYPQSYRYFDRNLEEIIEMIELISEYQYFDKEGNLKIMSYLSLDTMTRILNHRIRHKTITKNTVNKCIYLLTLTDIIIKEQVENVDKDIIRAIQSKRREKGIDDKKRLPNFLTFAEVVDLETVEEILTILRNKKFNVAGCLNYEWIYYNYSQEIADKLFPQKFTENKKSIITENMIYSNDSIKKVEAIINHIHQYLTINNTNYIKNATLVAILKENKFPKIEKNLGKFRNKAVAEYENYFGTKLYLDKINKDLKEELGISEVVKGYIYYIK
ncbi:hypothetical protein [Enterococcus thailandicus]|uniref:hypothetical protein n=1 Tax=Enterococcus thailandicus TaxID=417368 RepID=UPI0035DCDD8F